MINNNTNKPKPASQLETHLEHNERYTYEGGFRAEVIPGAKVKVQIVGMGFEARDTSEIVHEEYEIPWENLPDLKVAMDGEKPPEFQKLSFIKSRIITEDEYMASAKNRLDFLVDACKFPVHLVLKRLFMHGYHTVGDETVRKILRIFVYDYETRSRIIYGEIIGGHIKTWEHSYNTPMIWY